VAFQAGLRRRPGWSCRPRTAAGRAGLEGVEKVLSPLDAWSAERKRDVGTLPSPPASRRSPVSSRRRDRAGCSPVLLPALGGIKRTTAGILWGCRTISRSTSAPLPTTGAVGRPPRRSSRLSSARNWAWREREAPRCWLGTRHLTVRIAHLFEEAVGLDPDPALLAEARQGRPPTRHHEHRLGPSPRRGPPRGGTGTYRVGSFGQSFHWTDEARVAEAVDDRLAPGGAVA
jgi:hypothetical protein